MVAQLKDLDLQVQETATDFPGEVVQIRYSVSHDWSGYLAIFFASCFLIQQAGQRLWPTLRTAFRANYLIVSNRAALITYPIFIFAVRVNKRS